MKTSPSIQYISRSPDSGAHFLTIDGHHYAVLDNGKSLTFLKCSHCQDGTSTRPTTSVVTLLLGKARGCTCAVRKYRGQVCKHMAASVEVMKRF